MGRRARRSDGTVRWSGTLLGLALLGLVATVAPPVAAAASLRAYAASGTPTADPGDTVMFTLAVNNTGPAAAARVWANVTYPPYTAYAGEGPLPMWLTGEWFTGNRRGWNLTNLPVANHTWTLSLRILVGPPDQTVLDLPFFVNYTDDAGVLQAQAMGLASVKIVVPTVGATMTPSVNPVDPGQPLTYTIVATNRGNATSNMVWVNDTLPPQVTFVNVNPPSFRSNCPVRTTPLVKCLIPGLPPGSNQTYSIDVTVRTTAVRGSTIVNTLFVNYTDDDGTFLTPVSAQAYVDVRVIQDLTISKAANTPYAFPGQTATFTVWYNNTAGASLGRTWINDTLPAGMTHVSSTPSATVAGASVLWQFAGVTTGPHSARLVVRISSSIGDGTVLVNQAYADYVTGTGQKGQRVGTAASVLVSADLPGFEFAKVASEASVRQDGTVRYTVYYNNTGTNVSAEVVIEDTIPAGTVLTNPSEAYATVAGRRYTWRFANVAANAHRTVTYGLVVQSAAPGTNLINAAFLNFTDPLGSPLPSPPFRSAVVLVTGGGGVPPAGDVLVPSVIAIALAVGGLVAYRFLGNRTRTVIDEVFLLHRDGLLIKHYTRRVRPDIDSDILSGMLIAVQNFVNESFLGAEGLQKEGTLDELRFGEFKMVIERGQWVVVAAVLTGDPTNRLKAEVGAAIRALEGKLGTALERWSGDMRAVEGADRFMQDLIGGKYRGARGKG